MGRGAIRCCVPPGRTARTKPTPIVCPGDGPCYPRGPAAIRSPARTCRSCWLRWPTPPTPWPGSTPASRPPPVRDGLLVRLALAEAAGWLAHSQAWIHPLDLALHDAGLTAPAALAAFGAGSRALPHTVAQPAGRLGWEEPSLESLPAADQGVADALGVASLLRRLPGGGPHPFG